MSLPERVLWQAIRRKQAGLRFRRQHPAGRYVLDFYCDAAKLCIEVDGESHDFRASSDRERDEWLASQGVRTIRIPALEILRNLQGVILYIDEVARSPSVPLRGPPPPEGEE